MSPRVSLLKPNPRCGCIWRWEVIMVNEFRRVLALAILAREGPGRLLRKQGRPQSWLRLAGLCGGGTQERRGREGPCRPTGPSHSPQRGSVWTWPRSAWAVSELAPLIPLLLWRPEETSSQGRPGAGVQSGLADPGPAATSLLQNSKGRAGGGWPLEAFHQGQCPGRL